VSADTSLTRQESTWQTTRQVLADRTVRRLFAARSISVLGDMLVPVALAFAILDITHDAAALGVVLAARALPAVVFLLVGGALGDRYPRRTIMVASNLVACATQLGIGVVILANGGPIWAIAALTAVRGAVSAFFNPASTAAVSAVAEPGRRQPTFALFSLVGTICEVSGPAVAGLLLLAVSPGWVLVIDAGTFLVSALLIGSCGPLGSPSGTARRESFWRTMTGGWVYVRRTRWLVVLIASATIYQFSLLSSVQVLGPLVADRSLGGSSAWAAVLTALGAGGVLGSWLGLRFQSQRPLLRGYQLMLFAAGPTLLLLAIPAPLPVLICSEFAAGAIVTYFSTVENAVIGGHVPAGMLSRVDAVNRFGSMALRPLGMALVGPVAAAIGLTTTLVGGALLTLAAVAAPLAFREVRDLPGETAESMEKPC
jgi:MFS family permease